MAPPAGSLRVGRYFLALGLLIAVLYGVAFFPGSTHTPKLGLDLVGGAQVVLQASTTNGSSPSRDAMNEARSIIEQRVNGSGVSNSEVAIEGSNRITVTVPGKRADDIANVGETALLEFRPLIAGPFALSPPTPTPAVSALPSGSTVPSGATPSSGASNTGAATSGAPTAATVAPATSGAAAQGAAEHPLVAATTPAAGPSAASAAASPSAAVTAPATPAPSAATSAAPTGAPAIPGTNLVTADQLAAFAQDYASVPGVAGLTEAQVRDLIAFRCGDQAAQNVAEPIVTCDATSKNKYLLDKQLFAGTEVKSATAQAPGTQNVQWTVSLSLKGSGQSVWSSYTEKHHNADSTGQTQDTVASHYVAFTLDGEVISAPNINAVIPGDTQISGSFTGASATQLANSLKYGALPLSFKELTSQTVSATLGTSQLKAGLLAGGIGLALVIVYSLLYYRALGLVTLASLVVSGSLIYAMLIILGRQINFTLTLAGVAGFIVAVGITADSFVVFFERIKDEVHEGRSIRVAVPRAWARARRTVLTADVVSLLAAAVLYVLAAGDVRGFAFTLGMSTIVDVLVVFAFTHPIVSLLSRSRAFGSPRFTGLNAVRAGVVQGAGARVSRAGPTVAAPATPAPGSAGTITLPAGSSVAVLDRPDPGIDEPDAGEPFSSVSLDKASVGEVNDPDEADAIDPGAAAPVGASAVGGTAAERAAARRARLKAERGGR